jgi:hypothetical protein
LSNQQSPSIVDVAAFRAVNHRVPEQNGGNSVLSSTGTRQVDDSVLILYQKNAVELRAAALLA